MFKDVRHVSLPLGGREEEWPAIVCQTSRQDHTPQRSVAITVSIDLWEPNFKMYWSVLINWLNIFAVSSPWFMFFLQEFWHLRHHGLQRIQEQGTNNRGTVPNHHSRRSGQSSRLKGKSRSTENFLIFFIIFKRKNESNLRKPTMEFLSKMLFSFTCNHA